MSILERLPVARESRVEDDEEEEEDEGEEEVETSTLRNDGRHYEHFRISSRISQLCCGLITRPSDGARARLATLKRSTYPPASIYLHFTSTMLLGLPPPPRPPHACPPARLPAGRPACRQACLSLSSLCLCEASAGYLNRTLLSRFASECGEKLT